MALTAKAQAPKPHAEFNIGCNGWSVLAFAGQASKVKDLEPIGIDGVEVQVRSHKFTEEQLVFLEDCEPKATSKPMIEDDLYGRYGSVVREFKSYEVHGRIFAYSFICYVVMAKDGYITERAGAVAEVYYIDEDGAGTFERYQGAMPLKFLPGWVKAMAAKS